jgi:hypothetical protein
MTQRPRMRPGEGITGSAAESREPVMIPARANVDPRFKNFPNLPRTSTSRSSRCRSSRGERSKARNIRTRDPRTFTDEGRAPARDRGAGCAVDRARSSTRRRSGACTSSRRSRGSPRRVGGALPRGVASRRS